MKTLSELNGRGKYVIIKVLGDHKLVRRLAEMGMIAGKSITIITPVSGPTGLTIFFQGQRLAISDDIAERIVVRNMSDEETADLHSLSDLAISYSGIVTKMTGGKELRKRLMDMGLTKGTMIKVNNVAPLGDPVEIIVRGYKLSLRKADASNVLVEKVGEG